MGRRLTNFYPYITAPSDEHSILIRSLPGFDIESFDTSDGVTISFWAHLGYDVQLELFRTATDVVTLDGYRVRVNGSANGIMYWPITPTMLKIDLVFEPNGLMQPCVNGQYFSSKQDMVNVLSIINSTNKLTILKGIHGEGTDCIQHFSIRKGTVSTEQLYQEYNSYITDNIGDL